MSNKLLTQAQKLLVSTQKTLKDLQKKLPKKQVRPVEKEPEYEHLHTPKHTEERTVVDVSVSSVTKGALAIVGILVLIYFLYTIQSTLVLLFVSLILAAALDPLVDRLETRRIPRGVSVLLMYLLLLVVLGMVVYSLIPIIVEQIITMTRNISTFINTLLSDQNREFPLAKELKPILEGIVSNINKDQLITELQKILSTISTQLANIAGNLLSAVGAIFNGFLNAVLVLVVTFFMVTDKKAISDFIHALIPSRYAHYFTIKAGQMQKKIGGWVRGQILLCLAIGVTTYIGLFILQMFGIDLQYKETLAVVAGVTEIVPIIGPLIGAIPAILIALNVSWWAVVWVVALYVIIQNLENNLLVPFIMNREVGLNPIVIIIAMLVGAQFFGILGIILAVPVSTSISVLVEDYIEKEK